VAGLFALALAPRLGLAISLPADDNVFSDQLYLEYARHLAEGSGFWGPASYPGLEIKRTYAFRPPLFPFLWGCVYNATGGAYAPIRIAHAVLASLACLAAFGAGRELFRDARVAALAAALAAVYPPLVWHGVHLMTEPLFIFFTMLMMWALLRSRREKGIGWAALAGAAAGLGVLSRSVLAGFVPLAGVWLWWVRGRRRGAVAAAAVLWLATAAVMAPWVVRNAVRLGRFVPLTTDAGHGSYVANNPRALDDPRGFWVPASWEFLKRPGEARLDDEVEISRRLSALAVRFLAENPWTAAKLMARRLWCFWRPWPHTEFVPVRVAVLYGVSFVPCALLMAPGFAAAWRRSRGERAPHALVLMLAGFMTAVHTAVLAMTRYREPLMPVLLVYTAYSAVGLWDLWRARTAQRGTGDAAHFDAIAADYDCSLPEHVQEHYLTVRERVLGGLLAGGVGLDVGCGTGRLMQRLSGRGRVYGVDGSMGMLRVLRQQGRGRGVKALTHRLPFADASFDLVWCVAVLHHLASKERVAATVAEMVRVTRPGGHVVIWDHNPLNPYWPVVMGRVPQDQGRERLVPAAEIEAALREAGASAWSVRRMGFVPDFAPRWAMGLFRLVEAVVERTPVLNRLAAHNVVVARK